MEESDYTLSELSEKSGVPVRTIRYYITKHLLPSPTGKGPSSRYSFVHLTKLAVIRRLQDEGASLDTIGRVVAELDEEEIAHIPVRQLIATVIDPHQSNASLAQDYAEMVRSDMPSPVAQDLSVDFSGVGSRHSYGPDAPRFGQRSHWEHVTLTSSIELHVRRPLPSSQRKALEQLLDVAKNLFGDRAPGGGL